MPRFLARPSGPNAEQDQEYATRRQLDLMAGGVGSSLFVQEGDPELSHNEVLEPGDVWILPGEELAVGLRGDTGEKGDKGDQGDQGDPGATGPAGPGLEFIWTGTELGVRIEGESSYSFVDLKGDTGASIEFDWDGTQLGIRPEGDPTFSYVDLKGDKGDQGDQGHPGLLWQGEWDAAIAYDERDVVFHLGSSWVAVAPNTNSEPTSGSTDWEMVAQRAQFQTAVLDDLTDVDVLTAEPGDSIIRTPDGFWIPGKAADTEQVTGVIFHGTDPDVARPDGFARIEWVGEAEPVNATGHDIWTDTGSEAIPVSTHHGDLQGLQDGDPHTQYAKLSGAAFTGTVAFDEGVASNLYMNTRTADEPFDAYPSGMSVMAIGNGSGEGWGPGGASGYGLIYTYQRGASRTRQFHYHHNSNQIWTRHSSGGIWSAWSEVVTSDDGNLDIVGDLDVAGNANFQDALTIAGKMTRDAVAISDSVYERVTLADGGRADFWTDSSRARLLLRTYGSDGNEAGRIEFDPANPNLELQLRILNAASVIRYRLESGNNRHRFDGNVFMVDNFDVSGTKNARIVDPDDDTKAYRFAAVEADEPGVMLKRLRNVEVGASREARVAIPEHFARIGEDPMVFATYAAEPSGQTPHGPWAFVEGWDTGNPEVVLRAPEGAYHLLLTFCRNDVGVGGWEHVTVNEPEPDLETDESDEVEEV